jgi:UDP-N-acetylglucosamine 4,6-dehydratase
LKQVPATEYNPTEAVRTNVHGTQNVVEACVECGVEKAVFISSDKAVNPINLYGATKLVGEKLFLAANAYNATQFSCVRYGNVIGSRGSVVPLFQKLKEQGIKEFPITSLDMTRFWITIDEAVNLVFQAFNPAIRHDKIHVPYAKAASIKTIAKAIEPQCTFKVIGVRPGEKIHEVLISEDNKKVLWHKGLFTTPRVFTSNEPEIQMTIEEVKEKML